MEHESFEHTDVAAALNQNYISIKVDREERPDIDTVYMQACQAMNGSGGWPLTIIMTPEKKPFFTATYLPRTSQGGMTGILELLSTVTGLWRDDRGTIETAGEALCLYLRQQSATQSDPSEPDKSILKLAAEQYRDRFDPVDGGFGSAPKFPTAHNLLFLLRYAAVERGSYCRSMAEHTLAQMYRGGIFDHIGGGFSRYSTDQKWLIPHFEKMLYDNALLTLAYTQAYEISRRPLWERVIRRTLSYVLSQLQDPNGGFYCGQDADSEGIEGKYYAFTPMELDQVLGPEDAGRVCRWFQITEAGNFEGKNIPNLLENPDWEQANPAIDELCRKLEEFRFHRAALHKDDKILTAWNGLMIAAFAKAGFALHEPRYLQAAEKAHRFLSQNLKNGTRLFVRFREGEAAHNGQLDDYAFYAFALLAMYETTFDVAYLMESIQIAQEMLRLFFDETHGGFYFYSAEGEALISRPKELYDGAMPSGNSVAAVVLGRLSRLTGEQSWREASGIQLRFLSGAIRSIPMAHSVSLLAMMETLYPSAELLCATADDSVPPELLAFLSEHYRPNLSVLVKNPGNAARLEEAAPFTKHYPIPERGSAFYLCRNGACDSPVYDVEHLRNWCDAE